MPLLMQPGAKAPTSVVTVTVPAPTPLRPTPVPAQTSQPAPTPQTQQPAPQPVLPPHPEAYQPKTPVATDDEKKQQAIIIPHSGIGMSNSPHRPKRMARPRKEQPSSLRPGERTEDGGKFEPEKEPIDLGEFISNQFKDEYGEGSPHDSLDSTHGYILEDGTPVSMGKYGTRGEDHRGAIPTDAAMKRWGWPQETHGERGNRSAAMIELMRRARAVRVHVDKGMLMAHFTHKLTRAQKYKLLDFVGLHRPNTVVVEPENHMSGGVELHSPEVHEVEEVLDNPYKRKRFMRQYARKAGLKKIVSGHYQYTHPSGKRFIITRDVMRNGKTVWLAHKQTGPTPDHYDHPFDAGESLSEAVKHCEPGEKPVKKQRPRLFFLREKPEQYAADDDMDFGMFDVPDAVPIEPHLPQGVQDAIRSRVARMSEGAKAVIPVTHDQYVNAVSQKRGPQLVSYVMTRLLHPGVDLVPGGRFRSNGPDGGRSLVVASTAGGAEHPGLVHKVIHATALVNMNYPAAVLRKAARAAGIEGVEKKSPEDLAKLLDMHNVRNPYQPGQSWHRASIDLNGEISPFAHGKGREHYLRVGHVRPVSEQYFNFSGDPIDYETGVLPFLSKEPEEDGGVGFRLIKPENLHAIRVGGEALLKSKFLHEPAKRGGKKRHAREPQDWDVVPKGKTFPTVPPPPVARVKTVLPPATEQKPLFTEDEFKAAAKAMGAVTPQAKAMLRNVMEQAKPKGEPKVIEPVKDEFEEKVEDAAKQLPAKSIIPPPQPGGRRIIQPTDWSEWHDKEKTGGDRESFVGPTSQTITKPKESPPVAINRTTGRPAATVHTDLRGTKLLHNLQSMRRDINDPKLHKLIDAAVRGPDAGEGWDMSQWRGDTINPLWGGGGVVSPIQSRLNELSKVAKGPDKGRLRQWRDGYEWNRIGNRLQADKVVNDSLTKLIGGRQTNQFSRFIKQYIPTVRVENNADGGKRFVVSKNFTDDKHMTLQQQKAWGHLRDAVESSKLFQNRKGTLGGDSHIDEQILKSLFRHMLREKSQAANQGAGAHRPVATTRAPGKSNRFIESYRRRYARQWKETQGWMSPSGKYHEIPEDEFTTHGDWVKDNAKKMRLPETDDAGAASTSAYDHGWLRVFNNSRQVYATNWHKHPTTRQVDALRDLAIETGTPSVYHEGPRGARTLWSIEDENTDEGMPDNQQFKRRYAAIPPSLPKSPAKHGKMRPRRKMTPMRAPAGGIIVRESKVNIPGETYHGGLAYIGGKIIPSKQWSV